MCVCVCVCVCVCECVCVSVFVFMIKSHIPTDDQHFTDTCIFTHAFPNIDSKQGACAVEYRI